MIIDFLVRVVRFLKDKIIFLKNLFYYRYDRIKVPEIKPWEYCDKTGFLLYADMKILVDFVQKQNPQGRLLWYEDENGIESGHKLGQDSKLKIFVQEYRGKFVMDVIKQIYNFWKIGYEQQQKQIQYLKEVFCTYIVGKMSVSEQTYQVLFDTTNLPSTVEEIKDLVDWQILDKYLQGDRQNFFKERFLSNKIIKQEIFLQNECQKYLHLLIDVRPYLWT